MELIPVFLYSVHTTFILTIRRTGLVKKSIVLASLMGCFLGLLNGPGAATCLADVFTLRNGDVVDGTLFRETEDTYMVLVKHLDGQKMVTIKKRDVVDRSESVEEKELIVGLIAFNSQTHSDPGLLAGDLVECLERSCKQGDDLTLVVFDDLSLDAAGAMQVSDSLARLVQSGSKSHLVGVLGRCSGPAAVLASCFPRKVALPNALLQGPTAGDFDSKNTSLMRDRAEICHAPHAALVEVLAGVRPAWHVRGSGWVSQETANGTGFDPVNGRFSLRGNDLLETETAVASCQSIDDVASCLGHEKVSMRTIRPRAKRQTPSDRPTGLQALIPRRISDFNEGLAKAKEGIEILRRTESGRWLGWSSSFWRVKVRQYWERDHDRGLIPNSTKKLSSKAQRLIKSGLKKAVDCAQFLERQAKHKNDPRLLVAASHIRTMIDLEGAVENEIQKNFESKCDAVLNIAPLAE